MDNLTHSLVGALIGQTGLKKKTGLAMPALIIGANLPDVDAACFFWLEGTEHLGFRRGITHGPPAWVLLPLILAGLLWWFDRWQTKRGKRPEGRLPVDFKWLYILGFIGCLSHPALDWLNVYGVRLLEPFSSQWFYGDTLFIIDVWLWALLAVSVWWSMRAEKRAGSWRRPALVGAVLSLGYIALNGALSTLIYASASHPYALFKDQDVIVSPVPLAFWQREVLSSPSKGRWNGGVYTLGTLFEETPLTTELCVLPNLEAERSTNSPLDAFLFWSRAPFATRAEDGSIILHDARFYDPLARDRFSVALPNVDCAELPSE
ncbi:metal-dependent hydrolase [uncultured Erythrobacter sp.]|uniref:metal-dependent hydrolase n=1 Tax=uncultured Erythrobacter sp. TaxID=263913 RepID=UPI0026337B69|nr:metal-dependent hydrolase [uncultured Erythrobacter sp.]